MEEDKIQTPMTDVLADGVVDDKRNNAFLTRFIKHVLDIFSKRKLHDSASIENILSDEMETDEQKELIAEMCADIDEHHALMRELNQSGKDADEWYAGKLLEINSDCTEEEIEYIDDTMDEIAEIDSEARADALEITAVRIQEKEINDSVEE